MTWCLVANRFRIFRRPTFPSTCLSPDQPGYGQVVPTGQGRRRTRRSATQSTVMQMPQMPRPPGNWPAGENSPASHSPVSPLHPVSLRQNDYPMGSPYPSHMQAPASSEIHMSPMQSTSESMHSPRYGDSYSHPPSSYRTLSAPSRTGLSLDIRSLSMRERSSEPSLKVDIKLPPIHSSHSSDPGDSPYALPPISAMEDVRGSDSAAVLRRLRMDDDHYPRAGRSDNDQAWARRHSLSVHPSSS